MKLNPVEAAEPGGEEVLPFVDFSVLRYSPQRAAELLGVVPQTLKDIERECGLEIERVPRGTATSRAYSLDDIFNLAHLRRQRGSLKGFDRPITISTFIPKGGTGKTTTSVSLAIQFALAGHRVLLIDNDPQGDASTLLGYDPDMEADELEKMGVPRDRAVTGHVGNLMRIKGGPAGEDLETVIRKPFGEYGPHLIPADGSLEDTDLPMRMLTSSEKRYGLFLEKARAGAIPGCDLTPYDVVVIDNAPGLNMLSFAAMYCADFIVCPIRMEKVSFKALTRLHRTLVSLAEESGRMPEVIALPTMYVKGRPRVDASLERIASFFPGKTIPPIYRSEDFDKSMEDGIPVPLWASANNTTSKAQREMFSAISSRIRRVLSGGEA